MPQRETDVVIRRAVPADADAVADLWWRSRQAAIPAIPAPVHPFSTVRSWLGGLIDRSAVDDAGSDAVEVWLATAAVPSGPAPGSGPLSGAVLGVLVLDGGELDQLYVDPAETGGGIGSRLVAHAQRRRPDGLALWTFRANGRARAFYRHHAFEEGRTTDAENEEGAPDVRLTWRTDESRD